MIRFIESSVQDLLSDVNVSEVYEVIFEVNGNNSDFVSLAIKQINENKKAISTSIGVGDFVVDSNDGVKNSLLFGTNKKIIPLQLENSLKTVFSANILKDTKLDNITINNVKVSYVRL